MNTNVHVEREHGAPRGQQTNLPSLWAAQYNEMAAIILEHAKFENLMAELSGGLSRLSSWEIGGKIIWGLGRLAFHINADRVHLVQFPTNDAVNSPVYSLHSSGLGDERAALSEQIPWIYERLRRGEAHLATCPTDLPTRARSDRSYFRENGIVCSLAIPIEGESGIGFGLFCESFVRRSTWSEETVRRVKLVGELLCGTLTRHRSNKTIQELRNRLVTTQDLERSRIARELHDDVNQRLALLCVDMERLKEDCDETAAYAEIIDDLLGQTRLLASDIGKVCHQLYPCHLDNLGLAVSLQSLCREISQKHGVQVNLKCHLRRQQPPKETAFCLYRVAQEALHNVVKHSQASEATVELKGKPDGIEMSISDSGTGFDTNRISPQAGLGLRSMRDRVRLIRGHLSIESGPSKGSRLSVWVPIG